MKLRPKIRRDMARRSAYRWQGWDYREPSPTAAKKARRPKGITNAQAQYLAALQRKAGIPYSGAGMTCNAAKREIARLVKEAEASKRPRRSPGGGRLDPGSGKSFVSAPLHPGP